jgi:8'-apo-carotenoid 13,14-cleaving dioxygenase
VRHGPMIHDCMITKNFVLILDLPVTLSKAAFLKGYEFPYLWNGKHAARVGVLPREGTNTDIVWCDVDPCYVFHVGNAFENADQTITLDACAHDTMFKPGAKGPDASRTPLERWIISLSDRKVRRSIIDGESQEFPRVNEARLGQPYRYLYTMPFPAGFEAGSPQQSKLFKHDLVKQSREVHDFGVGNVVGEFVFVPRDGGAAEDDGYLMGYVVNLREQTTDFAFLNANDFTQEPLATVTLPHRIPPGFHGNWISSW